jgi:putative ABC transport system permease protein
LHFASDGYLTTLGIPLRDGRTFDASEIADARPVALVNETAATLWAEGVNPIGREIRVNELGRLNPNGLQQVTVIGVFADARNTGLDDDAAPAVLLPYTLIAPPNRTLAIRTPLEPGTVMTALRARVAQIDREVPLGGPGTLFDEIETQSIQPRFTMSLFSLFAALGLALAMAGIYSVLSYLVVRRTREIGLRMALGAGRREVLRMFMRHGGRLVAIGFGIGIVVSLGVARLLTSRIDLFQVSAFDPISIAAMTLILGTVATVACYVPARRATRVDPMIALRRD